MTNACLISLPMASSASSSAPQLLLFASTQKPCTLPSPNHGLLHGRHSSAAKFHPVKAKATPSKRNTKTNSVICGDCNGNGAVVCSQCKGSGVNSVDFFNGEFKAGESCWLCG
ncbi:hypothetical protein PTKIN_Ptkin19aG0119800 [Pterospermum kingtungense]